ncbi:MAG: ATP-binding protein [Negativicutes bacterium]|nr:ATP-binding protein [Negativicutes bacterium]
MRQMLLNFFRNALEAMPQGGTVTISTFVHDDKIVLSIRDEGEGIPPAVRERIGTPFVTTKEKGTGLGLSVCHRIAERHRAAIRIESQEGRGTTVEVLFPVNA